MPLDAANRELFRNVIRAAYANPFGRVREDVDLRISGLSRSSTALDRLNKVIAIVSEAVRSLESRGGADLRDYSGEDRALLENAVLFVVFHQYIPLLDDLIQRQAEQSGDSLPVPFAREIIAALKRHGCTRRDALRYLAMFFQMRRAYYFIDRYLIGESPCMRNLRQNLWNNIFTEDLTLYARCMWDRMEDFSTLLLGETGTGKGTAAAAIGRSAFIPFDEQRGCFRESFTRAFVSLNLSQFPETLIESELFGHRKGAFSGAVESHQGVFARCSRYGAIFLDEIGEVSAPIQIKLLQVLQERVFSPVGSHEKQRFSGRIIAATNRSLDSLTGPGGFREDFYFRLSSDVIVLPPLRQRLSEDPRELDRLLTVTLRRILGVDTPDIRSRVRRLIARSVPADHIWPGNVRELEQCVRRLLLKGEYIPRERSAVDAMDDYRAGLENFRLNARELLAGYARLLYTQLGTYEAVARRMDLDRRTVKKYIDSGD